MQKTTKIFNLLKEYQDVFCRYYKDLKGLVQEMGEMKIELLHEAKPINKRPYKLAHKYNDIVKNQIDNMLKVGIIYPVHQSKRDGPMVVHPKKHDPKNIQVCVDFIWLNKVNLNDHFPTPFADEIIDEVTGHESYSFTGVFSMYPQQKKTNTRLLLSVNFGVLIIEVCLLS